MNPMLEKPSIFKFRFQDTDSRKITNIIQYLGKSDYQSSRVLVGFMPADDLKYGKQEKYLSKENRDTESSGHQITNNQESSIASKDLQKEKTASYFLR